MYNALLIALTVIAMMSPSVYIIAWSKKEHKNHLPILYVGLGISGFTIVGAFLHSFSMMWLGLGLAFAFFVYVLVFYDADSNNLQD
jgi:hypothetical protein